MSNRSSKREPSWRAASWEGNREAQLESMLALTPAQRLAWLEEAVQLAWRSGALQRRRAAETEELLRQWSGKSRARGSSSHGRLSRKKVR